MRTDLAKEARTLFPNIDGVSEDVSFEDGIEISDIQIKTEDAAKKISKPVGRYVTVTFPKNALSDRDARQRIAHCCAKELIKMHQLKPDAHVMVIGLGNRYVTPDALGPKVAEHIFVTRHIQMYCRDILEGDVRTVTAFTTGVLGVTGMETVEVVKGLVSSVRPDIVLIVDALASMQTDHIGNVIQMNDSGINPGAGIGNFRTELNIETLGVPVITMGIPLVVSSATIAIDALKNIVTDRVIKQIVEEVQKNTSSQMLNMIVSPKDIDAMVNDGAKIISHSVNLALHGEQYDKLEKLLR